MRHDAHDNKFAASKTIKTEILVQGIGLED